MARIGNTCDTRRVKIRYLESENLDYTMKNGVPHIHRNDLNWISNVVLDINVQTQAAAADLASG